MTGGFYTSGARAALLATMGVLLIGGASAQAADLGGDCCADLEERIAELEATTARKGNRKVSLEIYGQVNEAIGYWDDGVNDNVYQFTNDTSRTRFGFKGKATIADGWYAEYRIEVGIRTANQQGLSQTVDDGSSSSTGPANLDVRHASWTLGSKTYGSVTMGETSFSTDGIKQIQTANIGHFANNDIFDFPSSFVIQGAGITWIDAVRNREPGEGSRGNLVRYESPEFAGFRASAHWGEDDIWGMALRYKGEFAGFKLAGGFGYAEMTETDEECTATAGSGFECKEYGGSASIMHEDTGIFVTGAYGVREDEVRDLEAAADGVSPDDNTHWLVQGGIEQKWLPLGKTTIFGGYQNRDAGWEGDDNVFVEVDMWELGLNQSVSAAAMDIYLHYKHYEADVTTKAGATKDTGEFQTVIGGAMIKF